MQKIGVVEDVTFTNGGAGNQWTTIEGVRYATYWNALTRDWKVGDTVSFVPTAQPLWSGGENIPHAAHIHKVSNAEGEPGRDKL